MRSSLPRQGSVRARAGGYRRRLGTVAVYFFLPAFGLHIEPGMVRLDW